MHGQVPCHLGVLRYCIQEGAPYDVDFDDPRKGHLPQQELRQRHTRHCVVAKITREPLGWRQLFAYARLEEMQIGETRNFPRKGQEVNIGSPCSVKRLKNRARHTGQARDWPDVPKSTTGESCLDDGIKDIQPALVQRHDRHNSSKPGLSTKAAPPVGGAVAVNGFSPGSGGTR